MLSGILFWFLQFDATLTKHTYSSLREGRDLRGLQCAPKHPSARTPPMLEPDLCTGPGQTTRSSGPSGLLLTAGVCLQGTQPAPQWKARSALHTKSLGEHTLYLWGHFPPWRNSPARTQHCLGQAGGDDVPKECGGLAGRPLSLRGFPCIL